MRSFIVVCCLLGILIGCAKKEVRKTTPFGLDSVLDVPTPAAIQENTREQGTRLARERKYGEAAPVFRKLVEEEPESFYGYNALAICHKNLGANENAMENFQRALEFAQTQEDKAKILANIGNLYFSANQPQAALGYYKEATAEFERNSLYLVLVARAFTALGDLNRARKVLAAAESIQPWKNSDSDDENGLTDYLMAYCYAALSDEDKALKHLEKAVKANPSKYHDRLIKDMANEKNLFYSLQGDPHVGKLLSRYKPGDAKR